MVTQFTGPVVNGLNDGDLYDGIKAFIYAQTLTREPEVVPRGTEQLNVDGMQRYMRCMMATYGALGMKFFNVLPRTDHKIWDNRAAIQYMTGIDVDKHLIEAKWRSRWTGSIFHPGYYLLLDEDHKELLIGIRGSWRLQDVMTDLMVSVKVREVDCNAV